MHTPQTIGQIYELDPNGHLVIKWADGSISQHFPQEIFIVSEEVSYFILSLSKTPKLFL